MSIQRSRRAVTFAEMMIVIAIFAFVGVIVMFIVLATARQSKTTLSTQPAEADAFQVIDRARMALMTAQSGSVEITDAGRVIRFRNPARDVWSTITFDQDTRRCLYKLDDGVAAVVWAEGVDGTFSTGTNAKRLLIEVRIDSYGLHNETITTEFSDEIMLRN